MNKLDHFFEVLNDPDKYPHPEELAEAAIDAKDELNALERTRTRPETKISRLATKHAKAAR